MRYKFRALDAAAKKWVYGYYVVLDSGFELVECIWELGAKRARPIDPDTLGQFTGLTDVNGVEIYEGDIIFIKQTNVIDKTIPHETHREVIFHEGSFTTNDIVKWNLGLYYKPDEELKVIGNIYQHKHLLKENEQ